MIEKRVFYLTWTESALIISPLSLLASSNASLLLPAPVGPEITITFSFLEEEEEEEEEAEKSRRRRWRKESAVGVRRRGVSAVYGVLRQHMRMRPRVLIILGDERV